MPGDDALRFAALTAQDARIARIGFALKRAGLPLCQVKGFDFGWVLDTLDRYGGGMHRSAAERLARDGRITVTGLVAGGPAEAAGLLAGDVIVAVNGQALPIPRHHGALTASYGTLGTALTLIEQASPSGKAAFDIIRDGHPLTIHATAVESCGTRVQLLAAPELNAFADDRYATVTTSLSRFAARDDELAFVLGHELAHSFLGHERLLDEHGIARGLVGNLAVSPRLVIETEREADYVALYLMARAGYDIHVIPDFWRRLAAARGPSFALIESHPSSTDRVRLLECTIAEIDQKQRSGEALAPSHSLEPDCPVATPRR